MIAKVWFCGCELLKWWGESEVRVHTERILRAFWMPWSMLSTEKDILQYSFRADLCIQLRVA